ncbi:MAG: biopolymer transporter ExbD [Candidatus Brocadiae bacterium]|nr:biopolymer transporter ExbD [Candidatus Brocadiia bacterium]
MARKHLNGSDTIISEINITPLTDVMLVLLIIFMVTATFFVSDPAMQVELPPAVSSALVVKEDGEITVVVNREGLLFVNDEPVSADQLTQALIAAARDIEAERKVVMVRGDHQAAYGQIIWIMDSARLVGLRHISLATERPEEELAPG